MRLPIKEAIKPQIYEGVLSAKGFKFALVVSRFNELITSRLLDGALDALKRHGAKDDDLEIYRVPGAYEIPYVAQKLAQEGRVAAIICLGAVIRGETPHFDYICAEVTKGIANVALASGVPVILGVLTTDTVEQAQDRAGGKSGNRGWDSAMSAMEMVNLYRHMKAEK